ncbi:hypothetical protein OAG1_33900 [Agarivorans sp. OAG1]|uniref:PEP-CTERM sorting domain-containing protein n=1 Tax=Agarivorans sp. OAG1 TaxID=3082387 RepID=UPI002B2AE253|nr:hypothetical protein OAG1_33900 [Agarivorans sp. OAG1]
MLNLRHSLVLSFLLVLGNAHAGVIVVDYNGSFDEADVVAEGGLPAGDFDTIGGVDDVALFNLVEGENAFYGSIYSPLDSGDVFNIGITAGMRLVGASIDWGTNLPGINWTFGTPISPDYRQQSTFGATAPTWFLEESSTTPEIFTIPELEDGVLGLNGKSFDAPSLDVTEGIYLSSLLDQGHTCAQTYVVNFPGYSPECVEGIDYKLTFIVESTLPVTQVSEPSTILLAMFAMLGFGVSRKRLNK